MVENSQKEMTFAGLHKHLKLITMKIILNVSVFDFDSDTKVGIDLQQGEFNQNVIISGSNVSEHFEETQGYHPVWSSLTFILMFIPGTVI